MFRLRNLLFLVCVLLVALPVFAQDTLVSLGSSDELGNFMVGPNGMTLYLFTRDPLDETVCYEQCATNWPPLTVENADEVTAAGAERVDATSRTRHTRAAVGVGELEG